MRRPSRTIKNPLLKQYWVELAASSHGFPENHPLLHSFGISAFTREDALYILARYLNAPTLPPIRRVEEDVDMAALDRHVSTNVPFWLWRGVWFPQSAPFVR